MYQLYCSPFSQHSRRVVSLLEETGIEYKLHTIDMQQGEYLSPEYSVINPNQQVPTLIDDDVKIHESNVILRYLCLKHKLNSWYPEDLAKRAVVEQWLDWNQCRLASTVVDIVLNKVFLGEQGDLEKVKQGVENLSSLFALLDAGLDNRDYLAGEKPSIADLSIASNIFQLSLAEVLPEQANIVKWYQRINTLPGFLKSLPQTN